MFTVFDRDALIEEFKEKLTGETGVQKFKAERTDENTGSNLSIEDWDSQMSTFAGVGSSTGTSIGSTSNLTAKYSAIYADEILPFDITITFNDNLSCVA